MSNKKINYRQVFLTLLFIFFGIHFLKDITQDILRIQTPLDLLGDVKEDLSAFSPFVQKLFYSFGVLSFIGEFFVLFSVPIVIKRKAVTRLEAAIYIVVVLILLFFLVVTLLDPRFRF